MLNCRKFSIYRLLDELVWLLVAFGPFIYYALYLGNFVPNESISAPLDIIGFFSEKLSLGIYGNNSLSLAFVRIFGAREGFFEFYESSNALIFFLTHFVAVQFAHVMFDLLCFIPKWCHETMWKFVYNEGEN